MAVGAIGNDPDFNSLLEARPHLFAALAVELPQQHLDEMARIVQAVERVVRLPAWSETVLGWAPDIARYEPKTGGVFFGYDFHVTADGPRLIEINTNAGGPYLNLLLLAEENRAQFEQHFLEMFLEEWRATCGNKELKSVAIVDEDCSAQYLYPEFLLFQRLFEKNGISCAIADAGELEFRDGSLYHREKKLDLVYNRLTDFSFDSTPALKAAYLAGVAVTPHPRAHALYADKRNLCLLSDAAFLEKCGVDEDSVSILLKGISSTRVLTAENSAQLWSQRRKLFFKPATGYGARAVYRGEKITTRVWEEIGRENYVAQEFVRPGEVTFDGNPLKYDVRNYVHGGKVFLLAARLYQGQTTNFRTPGGGFAQVFPTTD